MSTLLRAGSATRRLAGAALRRLTASPALDEREHRMLLLFCGRSLVWREPGRKLYQCEPRFRAGIDASDATVREIVGFSPSAAFSGAWRPSSWDEEVRSEVVTMALAQMGVADLWRGSELPQPGFLGLSGGEVAGAYGAGILSREDAVSTICWIVMSIDHPSSPSHSFRIEANERKAKWLCRSAPRLLEFGGEIIPGISHVRSQLEDCAENRAFLRSHVAILTEHGSYRYHVPETGVDESRFAAALPFTSTHQSHAPLYLCSFGGRVPEGFEFGWKHWAWMVSSPYRMAGASAAACHDGFNRVIVVGSATIGDWHLQTASLLGQRALATDAFAGDPDAANPWTSLRGQLDERRMRPPRPRRLAPASRTGHGIDLSDPVHLANPYAAYELLRQDGPVHYLPRQQFWIVLGHEEVRTACANPAVFSNEPYDYVDKVLIGQDPPQHAAIRRIIARHFEPAAIRRLEAFAQDFSQTLLKPRFDVVTEYAAPFSHGIAAQLLGLDEEGLAAVLSASEEAQDEPDPFLAVTVALDRLADRTEAYRRIQQAADGLLGDEEVRSLVRFLWLAAITTTERAIARAAMQLLARSDLLEALRQDRTLAGAFVEEVLRLNPPEHMLPRRATRDFVLSGVEIPAGSEVQLCTTAANRDPAVFPDPAAFRLGRETRHLSFGSGVHHCSGTALARRVIPVAVGALVDASGFRAIQPIETIDYHMTVKTLVPKGLVVGT